VQDAASILATFRSVSGETFTRALTLAQDMAAVFGQDLSSAATQLGKALEDPIDGLTALRRVGISFSDSQKELIKTLVETGQTAEAQRVILDALAQQVGGAGAAEAGGLTGATNRLQDAWGNLLEAIGRTPAVTGIAQGALTLLSGAIENLTTLFEDDPIGEQIEAAKARLTQARDELSRLETAGPGTPLLGQRFDLDAQRSRVAALEKELDALTRIGEAEAKATEAEKARAEGTRLIEATRTPAEQLAETIAHLDELMQAGAIDAETHGRALADAYAAAEDAADRALKASRDWQDGVTRGMRDYAAEATDAASHAEQVIGQAFQGMEDALVQFVQTGKFEFSDLADSIMADITRIAIRQTITGPLAQGLAGIFGGGGGGLFGGGLFGLFHRGGLVGEAPPAVRPIDPAAFAGAPRYHGGGIAGLQPDEIPAILKRGEAVLTERQMAAMGDRSKAADGGRPVTVVMNITTPDAGGFRRSQGQIVAEAARRGFFGCCSRKRTTKRSVEPLQGPLWPFGQAEVHRAQRGTSA
jgi:phage-related minor tail protein